MIQRNMIRRNASRQRARRRGAAVTEFAVCLPMLVTLILGSIQACNLLFLQQGLKSAVYEGCLEVGKHDASRSSIRQRVESILGAYEIEGGVVTISPETELHSMAAGTFVTITVSAPIASNLTGPAILIPSSTADSSGVTMR